MLHLIFLLLTSLTADNITNVSVQNDTANINQTLNSSINNATNETIISKSLQYPIEPQLPEVTSNISSINVTNDVTVNVTTPDNIEVDKSSVHLQNETTDEIQATNKEVLPPDDIPTFGEYRQMIETAKQQKRDESDNTPIKPSMVAKDDTISKLHTSSSTTTTTINDNHNNVDSSNINIANVISNSDDEKLHSHTETGSNTNKVANSEYNANNSLTNDDHNRKNNATTTLSSASPTSNEDKTNISHSSNETLTSTSPSTSNVSQSTSKDNQKQQKPESIPSASSTLLGHKNNVADKECGAKILQYGSQINHADFVLTNNRDEYMNMPCSSTDKWFVLETCEPVQIKSIQISNFEMFSSIFRTFKLFASDRYPVKHWHNLGTFQAVDEKGIQTFFVDNSNMVKYVKVELLDHYGNEHYCPLTFIRVLGNVVIDDDDDEDDNNNSNRVGSGGDSTSTTTQNIDIAQPSTHHSSASPSSSTEEGVKNGILDKAKNILVNMVNGIKPGGSSATDKLDVNKTDVAMESHIDLLQHHETPCYLLRFLLLEDVSSFSITSCLSQYPQYRNSTTITSDTINNIPTPFYSRVQLSQIQSISKQYPQYNLSKLYSSYLNITTTYAHHILSPFTNLTLLNILYKCRIIPMPLYTLPQIPNVKSPVQEDKESVILITPPPPYTPPPSSITSPSDDSEPVNTPTQNHHSSNGNGKKSQSQLQPEDSVGSNAWNLAFMRIKNLARQLEVNVSLSMRYLDQLSNNYKQQTEHLRKSQHYIQTNLTQLRSQLEQYQSNTNIAIQQINMILFTTINTNNNNNFTYTNINNDNNMSSSIFSSLFINIIITTSINMIMMYVFYYKLSASFNKHFNLPHNSTWGTYKSSTMSHHTRVSTQIPTLGTTKPHQYNADADESEYELTKQTAFPIVLPPKGVNLYEDNQIIQSDLHQSSPADQPIVSRFYTVNPSINFHTPTKNANKKKRRKN